MCIGGFILHDFFASEIETDEAEVENSLTHSEAVDELFATTYDSLRDTNANCITKTRDLIGKLIQILVLCSTLNLRKAENSVQTWTSSLQPW